MNPLTMGSVRSVMNKSSVEKKEMKIKRPIYMIRILIFALITVVLFLGSGVYAAHKLKAPIHDICYKCNKLYCLP